MLEKKQEKTTISKGILNLYRTLFAPRTYIFECIKPFKTSNTYCEQFDTNASFPAIDIMTVSGFNGWIVDKS